jgi:hypothetical protein
VGCSKGSSEREGSIYECLLLKKKKNNSFQINNLMVLLKPLEKQQPKEIIKIRVKDKVMGKKRMKQKLIRQRVRSL